MTTESNKQKVSKIFDMFPAATKDQIAKILQYYHDDENMAVDALTRDGGSEALSNWAESGSLKSKNNKNKKKRRKGRRESDLLGSATASFDADDSSSLHSSGNVDVEVEKECSTSDSRNGVQDSVEETKETSHDRLHTPEELDVATTASKDPILCVKTSDDPNESEQSNSSNPPTVPGEVSIAAAAAFVNPSRSSPVSDTSDKQQPDQANKHKSGSEEGRTKHSQQRTNSFRRVKTTSLSEDSTNSQNPAVPTKRGYEKCKKDLNRQSISLQRIHSQVDKGLEESSKKIVNVFKEIKKLLDQRQDLLEQELAKTKDNALSLLKSRKDLAVDLKKRVDRTSSMCESEWTELRSDVKQFVTERKYDDELGKTIWFQWSMDSITAIINSFGEVQPVKNVYSQRSHSIVTSAHNPEPSPSSSLANEEIDSVADKSDVANICDAVDEETSAVKKDAAPPSAVLPQLPQGENRARVFSNRRYQTNKGNYRNRPPFNRPYNNRPNHSNRGGYGRYDNNNYSSNYSNHHHSYDRVYDSSYSNSSDNRGGQQHHHRSSNRRGQNTNYHYRNNRGGYKSGQYRQQNTNTTDNSNSVTTTTTKQQPESTAAVANAVALDNEKSSVVNGYQTNN